MILLMGVTGSGKTTVGRALAKQLGWHFADADDFHSSENIARMRAGIPLTDEDRAPWLATLHDFITERLRAGDNVVLACSALKAAYRADLLVSPQVKLVHLEGNFDLIAERLAGRAGHYMSPGLLQSQFAALEEPSHAVKINVEASVLEIVSRIRAALGV